MVKVSQKIVRDAQYESQQRTVEVSLKPALGKHLFSESLVQASEGTFHGHFETERFLHGKIREYTLRAAMHWTDVREALPDARIRALLSDQTDNVESIKEISQALQYKAAAESIESSIGAVTLPHVPKDLRVYVLAKILHDLDVPLNANEVSIPAKSNSSEDRANLKMRLALRRMAKAAGISLYADAGTVQAMNLLLASQVPLSKTSDSNVEGSKSLSSAGSDKKILSYSHSAIMVFILSLLSKTRSTSTFSASCIEQDSQVLKHYESASVSAYNIELQQGIELSMAEGFGTAPIWYQQSMATGPPTQASRWEQCGEPLLEIR